MNASLVSHLNRHPSDQEIADELACVTGLMFGPIWRHCQDCRACHRRWLTALGLERLIR